MAPPNEERRDYVIARIQDALRQDERVAELELSVEVVGDTVVVSGTVETPQQREAIPEVVGDLVPGFRVVNEADVGAFPEKDEVERL